MSKLKTYKLKNFYGEDFELAPYKRNYLDNGRLAIELVDVKENEEFCVLTVNLDYELSDDDECLCFIDTNNHSYAKRFIEEYKIGEPTGYCGFSGYCCYPEYRINLNKLNIEEEE